MGSVPRHRRMGALKLRHEVGARSRPTAAVLGAKMMERQLRQAKENGPESVRREGYFPHF